VASPAVSRLQPVRRAFPHTTGLDLFIGEALYLYRGLGAHLIHTFIQAHVFTHPSVPDCIIDPLPDNRLAIRAYEKVGFVHETTFEHDGSQVYFMRLTRCHAQATSPLAVARVTTLIRRGYLGYTVWQMRYTLLLLRENRMSKKFIFGVGSRHHQFARHLV
jgi:hypothetical protein